ncbi:hypothetical protein K1W69_26165 [Hoeflea sp. WL0058]|uniref:OsmC-like protein n=1 Tax=Flavimaribacter sediminis TaxID=2865987 RepID=A0AAE3D4C5_9HYPH|nr:hypothetical protein [Flavimaribacter sediminis]MBW8640703.1 hypothetical protein [Flavimaribacter sediminis]
MTIALTESILQFGDPLGFKVRHGSERSPAIIGTGSDTFKVEARTLSGHQKEAIVTEGETGSVWRLASDEGKVMKGDDLAPFPLGYFNAGVMGDISNRTRRIANQRQLGLDRLRIRMSHLFGTDGSFVHSTAKAYSETVEFRIEMDGALGLEEAGSLIEAAMDASPAIALLRRPMQENTFALYINGRRRELADHPNSSAQDAMDPFLAHKRPPRPSSGEPRNDLIRKCDVVESGESPAVPLTSAQKRCFTIEAQGESRDQTGEFETDTWIGRPGMTHFRMISDESDTDAAPSGLGLMSAGIGLCYLTQLQRYIDAQKLDISAARLVQFTPFLTGAEGRCDAIDTHLFLNGQAPDEIHLNLLTIAARTCFMHVAASTALEPQVTLVVNGQQVG